MNGKNEIQDLQKRLTAIEQTHTRMKMWAGVIAACIAGMFGFSVMQIPKAIQQAIKDNASIRAAQGFEQAIKDVKDNTDRAAEGAKTSLSNALIAEGAVSQMRIKWQAEIAKATDAISEVDLQLKKFQAQHSIQVETLEIDNRILMAESAINFFESIVLLTQSDSDRKRFNEQLTQSRQKLMQLKKDRTDLSQRSSTQIGGRYAPKSKL